MRMKKLDCVNYVVTHKEYPIEQDDLYRGLCVGGFRADGMLSELDGENIAEYNDRINECTGLYWMWVNTDSDYVGLSHYRRYFCNNRFPGDQSRLDAERIQEILCDKGFDLIMTDPVHLDFLVFFNIRNSLGGELNQRARILFRDVIKERQPEYLDAYESVIHGNVMYLCNMFVTRREILNEYCEWLFSFLTEVADRLDVSGCTAKQKRTAGFYAEIFWTVWLMKQNYKVFSLPYVITDEAQ